MVKESMSVHQFAESAMSKAYEDDLINRALAVLEKRAKYATFQLGSISDVKNYLRLKNGRIWS